MFVGREEQISSLAHAYFEARGGAARIVLLVGEAGIGKSRLAREFAARVDASLLVGNCVPVAAAAIPFAPLADIVRAVRRNDAMAYALDESGTAVLQDLVGGAAAAQPSDARLDAGVVFEGVLSLFSTLSGANPLVVLFEDIHWADSATWDLLAFLSRALTDERLVVIATLRGDEVMATADLRRLMAELSRSERVHRLDLPALADADVAAHVVGLTGGAVESERLEAIVERSRGNPLFVQELTASAATTGTLPPALSDLLASKIASLPSDTQAVLRAMGIIGRPAGDALVAAALDISEEELEHRLRPAVDAGIVAIAAEDEAYAFSHPLYGEVAGAEAMPSERRRLHSRVADALAADERLAVTPVAAHGERAAHLLAAQRLPEALTEYLAAAAVNVTVAPGAAYRQLEHAMELWDCVEPRDLPTHPRRVDLLWDAAEMAEITGASERAIKLAQVAIASGDAPPDAARLERLARYLWAANRIDESEEAYARSAEAVAGAEPSLATAQALAGLGQAAYLHCRYAEAEDYCRSALAVAERVGSPAERISLHAKRVLAGVRSQLGDDDEAIDVAGDAYQRAVAIDDPERHLAAIYVVQAFANAGHDEEAVTLALDAMADSQRAGLYRTFGMYLAAMAAESMIQLGRWAEARSLLGQQPSADDAVAVTGLRVRLAQAWLASRTGEHAEATALLDRCDRTPADLYHRVWVLVRRAEAALNRGDWAAAADAADAGRATAVPDDPFFAARLCWLTMTARVELTLDAVARRDELDVEAERKALTRSVDRVDDLVTGSSNLQTKAFLQLARAEIARLDADADAELWAEAAHTWTRLHRPWPAARARLRQAEKAVAAGAFADAAVAVQAAHGLASALGSPDLTEAVERFAARSRLRLHAAPASPTTTAATHDLGLTSREAEVLDLVSQGHSNRQIGEQLYVSAKTVSVHVSNILRKLGVSTRVEAAAVAQRLAG